MLSKSILVAFLSLALTAQALPNRFPNEQHNNNNQQQCATPQTVVHTVTVTARGSANTGSSLLANNNGNNNNNNKNNNNNNKGKSSNGSGSNNNNNKGTSSNGSGSKVTSSAQATATAKSTGNAGNNNNNNNSGSKNNGSSSNNGGKNNNSDPQSSLTLDPRVIATGFENNGQDVPEAGQVASLTSSNNFINFCLTVPNLPITNGKQITTGSCNPAPIGVIPSTDNMPSAKFAFPQNFGTVKANQSFTIQMNIQNLETGHFVNAQENYFSAPQQLNAQGQIQGHSHVVIEQLNSLTDTTPTDPKKFAFFKGLNAAAVNGQLTASVDNGLAPGVYRLASINTAANHQPAIVPVAQHGSLDDAIYFTVTEDGKAPVVNGASGGKAVAPPASKNNQPPASKNNQPPASKNNQPPASKNNNSNKNNNNNRDAVESWRFAAIGWPN
ncbi:hypothetical protein CVT26_002020 [Gymnopilus dilepis]|uniref:Uncharacterized protein n=1 Tax=Gymnopilus dilepis TaxID=231916 RepID=A0A409VBT4_9AGAR|nr:hypothetical protein CVT26_002020 [Gymnopilus dilepis]